MLLQQLQKLPEPAFTKDVVVPFLEKVLGGRIEYTHSSTEAGRDLVVFAQDQLKQERIYCVQVKVTPISYGAAAFGNIVNTLQTAKREGVTLCDGNVRIPHEVWFIDSQTFPENERRQVRGSLEALGRESIRIIAGDEFAALLQNLAPEIASRVITPDAVGIVEITRSLFSHSEGHAFGLLPEKSIDEFYVTATISPSQGDAYLALDGLLEIDEKPLAVLLTPRLLLEDLSKAKGKAIGQLTIDEIKARFREAALSETNLGKEIERFGLKHSASFSPGFRTAVLAKSKITTVLLRFRISGALRRLEERARKALALCPEELTTDSTSLASAIYALESLQDFVRFCDTSLKQELTIGVRSSNPERKRIRLPHPEKLLSLGRRIIIDGPPGCGKTTLMKVMAVRLLQQKLDVRLVSCSQILPGEKLRSTSELVAKYCLIARGRPMKSSDVVLFDALDEGPSWLSTVIGRDTKGRGNVILSTRTAYLKNTPGEFVNLQLVPFSTDERDLFFDRWLTGHDHIRKKAADLVRQHPDLDCHTRLPLIATILVSLLVRDRTPHSRAAIYQQRLQLLLSDWDLYRSVGRVAVDDPSAKYRLLRELAFQMHVKKARVVSTTGIANIYAMALGRKGLSYSFDDMLADLVMVNGVLVEEAPDTYSFGHLTFQEHLVGEYLQESMRIAKVATFVGSPWWREPLNFWASIRGNLDDLVERLQADDRMISNARQLREMAAYAPYTSPGAMDAIKDSEEYFSADEKKDDETVAGTVDGNQGINAVDEESSDLTPLD